MNSCTCKEWTRDMGFLLRVTVVMHQNCHQKGTFWSLFSRRMSLYWYQFVPNTCQPLCCLMACQLSHLHSCRLLHLHISPPPPKEGNAEIRLAQNSGRSLRMNMESTLPVPELHVCIFAHVNTHVFTLYVLVCSC